MNIQPPRPILSPLLLSEWISTTHDVFLISH
jgi:hypothetical protein